MATVFFMKFNRDQGALVADEMAWHLSFKYGYRPSRYGDSILNLLDEQFSAKNNFVAVYTGVGFPSFHFEVARLAGNTLKKDGTLTGDLDKTGAAVQNIYQDVHARMINDKLRFNFGFDRDQLNNKKFSWDGKDYEIKQDAVIQEAKKIMKYGSKEDAYHRIFDNEGLLMGYDKENGIRAYHIGNDGRGLDFAYPFDAIGPGKEIGTKIFADTNYRMQLDQRREGFNFSDGLFLLMNCFVEAYDFNMKTGGYIQVFQIDGKREFFKSLTDEKSGHNTHTVAEIIRAYRWGYLERREAQPLMERLLIHGEEWEQVEDEMFAKSSDPASLKKHLMGYKPIDVPKKPLM